ncbi:MAG: MFS transporter [Methanobacteriota archaeon]|nr:MAG: MFS transporter [Euryarchaeota archaeon]
MAGTVAEPYARRSTPLYMVPIIALGFATTALTWTIFNIAIPVYLQDVYQISLGLTGFIMTWDNIIAFFLQPYIGSLSDRTRTRFGRRMPYIIVGVILGAGFFYLIPYAKEFPLYVFLGTIVLFNLAMALYRSPSVSLMPDLVESRHRSMGNGIVNLMGGIFGAFALFVGGGLFKQGRDVAAFGLMSIAMLISLAVLVLAIREPMDFKVDDEDGATAFDNLKKQLRDMWIAQDKSMLFMLLAIFSWFMAWNAIEAFYSTYVWKVYLVKEFPNLSASELSSRAIGEAGQILFVFPVVFVIFTVVGGIVGTKIGRIATMRIGLLMFLVIISSALFVQVDSWFGFPIGWRTSFQILFSIAAMGWGLINVNSIVVVWEHANDNGSGTGVYYAFSSLAAILGPTISGFLMDITPEFLFYFSLASLVMALVFLFNVKSGEAGDGKKNLGNAMLELAD